MYGQGRRGFGDACHGGDVGEIQARSNTLGVEVQGQSHQVHIAAALAVAEQAAFHTLGTGQQGLLGTGHASASVVMGVYRKRDVLAARQTPVHPLDLVGKHIGGGHLHGGRQVDDHGAFGAGIPGGNRGIAHGQGNVQLGHAKGFRRVLQHPFGFGVLLGQLPEVAHMVLHHGNDLRHFHAKDDFAEGRGHGVVEVHDHAARAGHAAHRGGNEVLTQLGDDHGCDVMRNQLGIDEVTHDVEVGLRSGGKANFDFLEADGDQLLEQPQLALAVHGLEQRLIAVAQIGRQPHGRLHQCTARPLAVGQVHNGKCAVFGRRISQHRDLGVEETITWSPCPDGAG